MSASLQERNRFAVSKCNMITEICLISLRIAVSFWGEKLTLHFLVLSERTRLPEGLEEKYCNYTPNKPGTAECHSECCFSRICDTLRASATVPIAACQGRKSTVDTLWLQLLAQYKLEAVCRGRFKSSFSFLVGLTKHLLLMRMGKRKIEDT